MTPSRSFFPFFLFFFRHLYLLVHAFTSTIIYLYTYIFTPCTRRRHYFSVARTRNFSFSIFTLAHLAAEPSHLIIDEPFFHSLSSSHRRRWLASRSLVLFCERKKKTTKLTGINRQKLLTKELECGKLKNFCVDKIEDGGGGGGGGGEFAFGEYECKRYGCNGESKYA